MSPNIIIPIEHQSAPNVRYDRGLARAAADLKDPNEARRRDFDAEEWAALNCVDPRVLAKRRAMVNKDFDAEFDSLAAHDPNVALLRRAETDPSGWVEENLELYARNCEKARDQQLPGQERWEGKENEDARLVNVLYPSAVMRKLRDAGVDARDEEHPNARIWLNDWSRMGLVGVNAWVNPVEMDEEGYLYQLSTVTTERQRELLTYNWYACRAGRKVQRTLTSLQDPGPEWSLMRINERGVATKEKYRGWRTAMLVLIVAEILTEEEVDRAFGPPLGEAGSFYRQQLKAYRQLKIGKAL